LGIINRFLLFIYAGVVLLAALFVIAFATRAISADILVNEVRFALHQSVTLTAFIVVAVFSGYFMLYSYFTGEKKEDAPKTDDVVLKTETGEVRIVKEAVEALADREATSVKGVRESITKVSSTVTENATKISLKQELVLLQGTNVPAITAEVTNAVKNRIFESLGVKDASVEISVRDLNSIPAENQKRVH